MYQKLRSNELHISSTELVNFNLDISYGSFFVESVLIGAILVPELGKEDVAVTVSPSSFS